MSSPHQDSLLPRFAQGEEGHETTTKFPCLVCVDRVAYFHERRSLNNFHRDRVITFEQIAE